MAAVQSVNQPRTKFPEGFKVYISGPMTGMADHNFPAFNAKAKELRALGFVVVNPAELDGSGEVMPWEWYLRRDLKVMLDCDGIYMLPDWTKSNGAKLEFDVAQKLKFVIMYYDQEVTQ